MRDNTAHNQHDRRKRPGGDGQKSPSDNPKAAYTPQQRRMIQKGLRILAKVAIRSHMRGGGNLPQTEDTGDEKSR